MINKKHIAAAGIEVRGGAALQGEATALALSLALLFVWSLPGTVALRALLLLGALVAAILFSMRGNWRDDVRQICRDAALPLTLITVLTLWLIGQGLWFAAEPTWSIKELRGQWLPALLALLLGLLVARQNERGRLVTAIVLVFTAQAAIAVGQSVWHWFLHDELLTQQVPLTGGKLEMSFVLNILLAFLVVDLFCRATRRPALLRLPLAVVVATLLLTLVSSLLAGARNGIIGIIFLSASALSLFVFDQHHRLGFRRTLTAAVAIMAGVAGLAAANYHTDPRWQHFSETAQLAWAIDTDTGLHDVEAAWPRLANGEPAETSAYVRIAYIRTGLRLIEDFPLGYGYGRNAFGHALQARGQPVRGHAHSGWIDLGIGGGIPALALWSTLLGSLMWRGWRTFFNDGNAHGLVLFFIATGYAGRMVLDSVNKDHMLQMFLFLIGILLVVTSRRIAR